MGFMAHITAMVLCAMSQDEFVSVCVCGTKIHMLYQICIKPLGVMDRESSQVSLGSCDSPSSRVGVGDGVGVGVSVTLVVGVWVGV